MRKISSQATFYYKRLFPLFFLFIVGVMVFFVWRQIQSNSPQAMEVFIYLALAGVNVFVIWLLLKHFILDLCDYVFWEGETLIFQNAGVEHRHTLQEIIELKSMDWINPPQIRISVRSAKGRVQEYRFMAPMKDSSMQSSAVILELKQAVLKKQLPS